MRGKRRGGDKVNRRMRGRIGSVSRKKRKEKRKRGKRKRWSEGECEREGVGKRGREVGLKRMREE